MAILRAAVEPELLIWARETRGLSIEQAAKSIGISEERLSAWELGKAKPTVRQLRKASSTYKRAIGLLFLPEPPEEDEVIRDFRRAPQTEFEGMSPALRLEIRLARERRAEAIDLAKEIGEPLPAFRLRASRHEEPIEVAARIRSLLGVSIEDQTGWSDKYDAFNSWRAAIERQGVLVFQTGGLVTFKVSPFEAHGFSISDQPLPVIVANSKDAVTRRCFTLLHELTHVVLHNGGLCDFHEEPTSHPEVDRVEVFCNRVAASVLVPEDDLVTRANRLGYRDREEWSDEALAKLARAFRVSWEVVLLRLVAIGRASQAFYKRWQADHPYEPGDAKGFITPVTRVVMRNGRLFTRLALGAYRNRHITVGDLAHLIGEGPQHIQGVEERVFDSRYVA
ncbi:MAG: ImmA/IrrE family metallo-endopeptidase [bacterium]|nr:ImmA/IrrE family metallo-endopeptidase [bacterium]